MCRTEKVEEELVDKMRMEEQVVDKRKRRLEIHGGWSPKGVVKEEKEVKEVKEEKERRTCEEVKEVKEEKERRTCELEVSLTPALFAYYQLDCPPKATTLKCQAIADTGAEACQINPTLFKSLGIDSFPAPPSTNICNYDGSKVKVEGCCLLRISDPEQTGEYMECTQLFYISEGEDGATLSLECCFLMGIVEEDFPRLKKKEEGKVVKEKDGNPSKETDGEVEKEEEDGEEKQE